MRNINKWLIVSGTVTILSASAYSYYIEPIGFSMSWIILTLLLIASGMWGYTTAYHDIYEELTQREETTEPNKLAITALIIILIIAPLVI